MQSARSAQTELHYTVPQVAAANSPTPFGVTLTFSNLSPAAEVAVPTNDFRTNVEQYVLSETNIARAQLGLPALVSDARTAAIAHAHSADMLSGNYFEHTSRVGCDTDCRLTNAGYVWRSYGENIHRMSGFGLSAQDTAKKIVNDWLNSPSHRTNMLGFYTHAGTGIAVSGDKVYSTTDYTTK